MADSLTFYTTAEVAELLRMNVQVLTRKVAAGEIPAYRIGRDWRIERAQLMTWLERHSNQRARTSADKTLDNFFTPEGRLKALPAKRSKREVVLRKLAEELEPDRAYPERELNAILRRFHDDVASIRREMVMTKILVRTERGVYRLATSGASAALHRA